MSHIVEYIQYKRTITITSDLKLSQCSAGVEIVLMGPGKKTVTLVLAYSSFTPVTFALLQWTHTCGDDLTAYVKETPKEKPVDFFLAKSTGKWQAFAALMVNPTRASKNCGVSVVPGLNEEINPRNQALSRECGHSVRSNSHRRLWFGLFKVRLRTKSNFYQHNYLVRPSRVWHRYKAHKGSAMCIERRGKAATPAEEEKKYSPTPSQSVTAFRHSSLDVYFVNLYIFIPTRRNASKDKRYIRTDLTFCTLLNASTMVALLLLLLLSTSKGSIIDNISFKCKRYFNDFNLHCV